MNGGKTFRSIISVCAPERGWLAYRTIRFRQLFFGTAQSSVLQLGGLPIRTSDNISLIKRWHPEVRLEGKNEAICELLTPNAVLTGK